MAILTRYLALDAVILFVALIFMAYLYMTRNFKYWKKRGVDEITPVPFVGNFGECLMAKKSAGQWVRDIHKWGAGLPYVGFYIFDKPALLIRDPELIKSVLVKDFYYFSDRYASASLHDRIGFSNLFLLKNPAWKIVRQKLTPIYTSGRLKKMFDLIVEVGGDLSEHMRNLHLEGAGKSVDFKDLCAKFTTDLIATTAFGVRANCLNNPTAEFREVGKKIFEPSLWRNFELTSLFFLPKLVSPMNLKFIPKESEVFMRAAITDVTRQREESGVPRNDLIDLLVELKKNNEEYKNVFDFEGDNLVGQAVVFFNAGFETTSSAISFTLYEMALQPEIQSKAREEILNALKKNDGKIDYDMIMELPYLDKCLNETLRKYATLPFLDRVTTENYKVPNSNLVLEKGTPIVISITGLHYDPQYFPDPDKYDPERFSEENKKTIKPFVYIPFGEGPHLCIGMRLGVLKSKFGLVKLLSEYQFAPCEKTVVPLQLSVKNILTTSEGGLFLNARTITT